MSTLQHARLIRPGHFCARDHFYPKVIDALAHPLIQDFFSLSKDSIASLFCEQYPAVDFKVLSKLLRYPCKYFSWAGTDLVYVQDADESRHMIILETNSCSSGQKHMPTLTNDSKYRGYERLLRSLELNPNNDQLANGNLAVIYDKNEMEASGYASALSELTGKSVFLAPFYEKDADSPVRFSNGVMEVRDVHHYWHPIRFALRYVTQRPWNRIPLQTITKIVNPVITCLAGGRNKLLAHKAYEQFNSKYAPAGLKIKTPRTVCNVKKNDIPKVWNQMGGLAVVKVPYSNAGQGIHMITNAAELENFMTLEETYEEYIVQSFIGSDWHKQKGMCDYYHLGTSSQNPDERFVFDLRMVVANNQEGFQPVALFSRRAKKPIGSIQKGSDYWDIFGTNLSYKSSKGDWQTDEGRLIPMTYEGFQSLGIGRNEVIEAYIQTVLSVIAIDQMADDLMNLGNGFDPIRFFNLNGDRSLVQEVFVPVSYESTKGIVG